ncbi:hypothetical protein CTI12_AA491170 [Artemisia annua]|uniref:Uncharacterized protein n=1 Tax=Artemisia annua TaxID=35608 RepID=A0A2U1LHF3_ARTAN|nr:hypothetical protein CTI12_AA491170 [Artemisia annua]
MNMYVNCIRELPQNKIVATHTDSPDVLIWDVEAQPNRHAVLGAPKSHPEALPIRDTFMFWLWVCRFEIMVALSEERFQEMVAIIFKSFSCVAPLYLCAACMVTCGNRSTKVWSILKPGYMALLEDTVVFDELPPSNGDKEYQICIKHSRLTLSISDKEKCLSFQFSHNSEVVQVPFFTHKNSLGKKKSPYELYL